METPLPFVRLAEVEIDGVAARLLGHELALKFLALPFADDGTHLTVAIAIRSGGEYGTENSSIHGGTTNENAVSQHNSERFSNRGDLLTNLADITGRFIIPVVATDEDLRFFINKVFGGEEINSIASRFLVEARTAGQADTELSTELLVEISAAPAVRLIDSLIEAGVINRASDIHIEPYGRQLRARYRVDGALITFGQVDISLLPNVISRLKIMSGMDISEKRLPQDGSFSINFGAEKIDFRLSTLPTAFGEKAVLRLLYGQLQRLKKNELGFFDDDLAQLNELFTRPYGAIFITGPTGSGKSTTLNCFLEELNDDARHIVTVEDPVENPILGVSHVNVDPAAGLTFAGALKHILRQDPDTIMVGEIRDEETARIAIQAAITGHVVLSTLHTNDAAGVIERLTDMGIEPYLAAAALNGVISQRLVRRICAECGYETTLTLHQARILGLSEGTPVRGGRGCTHCNFTGFRSRFAIYEYIIMDEPMRREISADPAGLAAKLRKHGNIRKNAVRSLLAGFTTADEVIRVLNKSESGDDDSVEE